MTTRGWAWCVWLMAWLPSACGGGTSSAPAPSVAGAPGREAAPPPLAGGVDIVQAPDEAGSEAEPPRPELVLAVEGGATEGVLYQGWPWCVQALVLRGEPPATLRIEGPTALTVSRVEAAWLVDESATAGAAEGDYTFTAGSARFVARVVAPPAAPSPAQVAVYRRLMLWRALAGGDIAKARAFVDAWLAAEPSSSAARAALGDVLRAAGDRNGALAAYGEAIERVPPWLRPPTVLHRRLGEMLRAQAAEAVATAPSVPTTKGEADPAPPAGEAPPAQAGNTASQPAPPGALVPTAQLDEARIVADAAGQWASAATAGSQYSAPDYGAGRATGAPDVPVYGNSTLAWCPGSKDDGTTWLEVAFATPIAATGVRVRQNEAPGAIVQVEAIADDGSRHVFWRGVDAFRPPTVPAIAWFGVDVPKTTYRVARLRLTLDLAAVPGWNQIDAVQLVGAR